MNAARTILIFMLVIILIPHSVGYLMHIHHCTESGNTELSFVGNDNCCKDEHSSYPQQIIGLRCCADYILSFNQLNIFSVLRSHFSDFFSYFCYPSRYYFSIREYSVTSFISYFSHHFTPRTEQIFLINAALLI